MKKSQMINLISRTLGNLSEAVMSNKLKADIILDEIEKAGMLPPSVLFHSTGEYEKAKNIVQECLSDYDASSEWESENE